MKQCSRCGEYYTGSACPNCGKVEWDDVKIKPKQEEPK